MLEKNSHNESQLLKVIVIENTSDKVYSVDIIPNNFYSLVLSFTTNIIIYIESIKYSYNANNLILISNRIHYSIAPILSQKIYIIAFNSEVFSDNTFQYLIKTYELITNLNHIVCSIQDSERKFLKKFFIFLKNEELTKNFSLQKEIFIVGFNYLKQKIFDNNILNRGTKNKNFNIFFLFVQLLELHFSKEHSVMFYADKLNITTNYLNKITKEFTKITAKKYIEKYLITESKLLLLNLEFSVSEISEMLGFYNLSSFSNFFKKHTGYSPIKYRFLFGNALKP